MRTRDDESNAWPSCGARERCTPAGKFATSRIMPSPSLSRQHLGLLLGFIGMAIFGGTLPATRIAVSAIDPMALTALRTAIAGLCSLALLIVDRRPLRSEERRVGK